MRAGDGAAIGAAPGADSARRTLILYDTTGQWGWLGEAFAVQTANLVSHGSAYRMQPIGEYTAGEMSDYTGVVYLGSTYNEPIPAAFLDDVLSGVRPVLWAGSNVWQLTARAGDFGARYGWTWTRFDTVPTPTVTYRGVELHRSDLAADSGLLGTTVTDPAEAQVLATASHADGSTLPWALRSSNLTYLTEVPFSYVGTADRYLAAADLLSKLADPNQPDRRRALVRIEDVSVDDDPAQLRQIIDYLAAQGVPFSLAVIPRYRDPHGYYNNGVPESSTLAQDSAFATVLRYAQSKGGTLVMHGDTHQYDTVANPYDAVSADDFEFYRSQCSTTPNPPYQFVSPCTNDDWVIEEGPVPGDSADWARSRVIDGKRLFEAAGLAAPTIFEPPHYAASATDYTVFDSEFGVRYDRGLYFGGWCPAGACGTGTPDYGKLAGQYFPYVVRDVYGSTVIPENLGNVELAENNHHPPRLPADVVASARAMTAVQDGVASFFYHPYLGTDALKEIVTGLKAQGWRFVPAPDVAAG
ncbi:polysaccharide deacetylase family protein [Amycolatopsis sp. A1MSW2902]|uniref:polysaccharide deacetylase family protein n=1 Tax=Amycolatopsis sp. A1MSW2902 TaxID=687413 RepID=UPI00307DC257